MNEILSGQICVILGIQNLIQMGVEPQIAVVDLSGFTADYMRKVLRDANLNAVVPATTKGGFFYIVGSHRPESGLGYDVNTCRVFRACDGGMNEWFSRGMRVMPQQITPGRQG
jgi:hypothetical protein